VILLTYTLLGVLTENSRSKILGATGRLLHYVLKKKIPSFHKFYIPRDKSHRENYWNMFYSYISQQSSSPV